MELIRFTNCDTCEKVTLMGLKCGEPIKILIKLQSPVNNFSEVVIS